MNGRRVIALLGGTFDPVHDAHVRLARRALSDLPVDVVRLVPNGAPPHRSSPLCDWAERVRRCTVALGGVPRIEVGTEESPDTPRYTIHTIRRHCARRRSVILVMGADAFAGFHHWRRWDDILRRVNIAVARRGGAGRPHAAVRARIRDAKNPRMLARGAGKVWQWRFRPGDDSATMIRARNK